MNLAILHFHLNRGGVTQVILNHLRALDQQLAGQERMRVALIHGGRSEGTPSELLRGFRSLEVSLHETPWLEYDEGQSANSEGLYQDLVGILETLGFSPDDSLLHIHNHSLGKNVSLPAAQAKLARDGYPLLLQIHDFAEDFRPQSYLHLAAGLNSQQDDWLSLAYPAANHIHYAVLNRRDLNVLEQAGVTEKNLHWLPNPVATLGDLPDKQSARAKLRQLCGVPEDKIYLLYPVRGIRRKNLGEAVLCSALVSDRVAIGFTLAPLNKKEKPSYKAWKELVRDLGLPCHFETGAEDAMSFAENLAAADLILTTSLAEGFGMVFLESWLSGQRLVGRDLPEITADFVDAGIRFDSMTCRVAVPIQWIGKEVWATTLSELFRKIQHEFGHSPAAPSWVHQQLDKLIIDDTVDFAFLPSAQQQKVIRDVATEPSCRQELLNLNPWCATLSQPTESNDPLVAANAAAVQNGYSLEASGTRLWSLYQRVVASTRESKIGGVPRPGEILGSFLAPDRLHPIRLES